jgi:hypothetical protein
VPAGERLGSRWPAVRALLIGVVLFVGLVAGLPIPSPRVQAEMSPWLRTLVSGVVSVQAAVLAPFAPVQREFALVQRWQLFAGANTERYRIWIEARAARGRWQLLYRPHDPEHAFLGSELEYRRVRGAWNPRRGDAQPGYPAFASWVSRKIFQARPELSETRARIEKIRILPGGRGFEGTGEFMHELRHDRRQVLP